ncbi:Fatty acid oxidation complex subunit alpha [Rubripirellula lacrimiformis]|uniref:enoyl-CoA hydratase n=1 Tax=Rubripirellula lacrimiformis TaxID=1930273 RepID=A0A517N924_9BACT|nr:3-hydroxyacyl-CoA dehydrogenase NAD-binding domain-containing protein [Rubripirellula lacrimiformis]QDT03636.1 Fatty acid oxidation complex subunit alpha [Rubripirellula lacrimiformis]
MNTKPYQNFDVTTDHRGVVTVSMNVPDRPLNVLTRSAMLELVTIVADLERSQGIVAVVFCSGKESGFLAGADVAVIADIQSPEEASHMIEAGQQMFARIESLPMPTIAVIHGPCLGGGLEWSLACDHRIARDNSSTKIGLPEMKLGLIPGWGGTQRLPRLIGLRQALPLILTGAHVDAKKAAKIGLIDRAILPDRWDYEIDQFVDDVVGGRIPQRSAGSLWHRMLDRTRLGRFATLQIANRSVRSKAKHYPALPAALRAMSHSHLNLTVGMAAERTEFVKLLSTPTCRHLLSLFFARERARKPSTWSTASTVAMHQPPIRKVGVVGAGAMGAGIGQLAATLGYDVTLNEVDEAAGRAGQTRIDKLIDDLAKRKRWDDAGRKALADRIRVCWDPHSLADCELVIEAVVERADVKADVFQQLDAVVKPSGILASNTSSLSVTRMGDATTRSQQVAGLHFFNPVHRMELVEVVRGRDTDDVTMARLVGFVRTLGKTPVVTTDTPGFLVNRVLFPYLGEAILMVAGGGDTAMIDRQVKKFGMPMGPLELLDQVGLDVAEHVAESLRGVIADVEPVVQFLHRMVSKGHLGRKSGQGFYRYEDGQRRRALSLRGRRRADADPELGFLPDGFSPTARRLVYPMLIEAVRCHDESVVDSAWAIDLAMVLGTGFAPHLGGPLHMIDQIGPGTIATNLRRLRDLHGDRFVVPDSLRAMSQSGENYFDQLVDTQSPSVTVEG